MQAADAESVLSLENPDVWALSNGDALRLGTSHVEGAGSLSVRVAEGVSLASAPFAFERTPNSVTLSLARSDVAGADEVTIFMECRGKGVGRELVGTSAIDRGAAGEFVSHSLAVPAELQTRLAGGCAELRLHVALTAGDYELDGLGLRAATPVMQKVDTPLCGLPSIDGLVATDIETPEGYSSYMTWIGNDVAQAELPLLEAALEPLQEFTLGPVLDHVNQQVVVVVDQGEHASAEVGAALEAAGIALPLRIQPACQPLEALRAAEATLLERAWHAEAPNLIYATYLDVGLGQHVVTLDPESGSNGAQRGDSGSDTLVADANGKLIGVVPSPAAEAASQALLARLGSAVHVKWGKPSRAGRFDDGQPHYGGAAIGLGLGLNFCTAGPIVKRGGVLGAITATHCFPINGVEVYSGPKKYGKTAGAAPFPQSDMTRIDPDGQRFANVLHTTPCCPSTRTQTGAANAAIGALVCASGMSSLAKCGIEVTGHNGSMCYPTGCTTSLTVATRRGVTVVQNGDSGAPVYTRSGATGAIINGMVVGRINNDTILYHRKSQLESTLGVTIAF